MWHTFAKAYVGLLFLSGSYCFANECAPPPVISASQAECLARSYVEDRGAPTSNLQFHAVEGKKYWNISYTPASSEVLGGGGDLRVAKRSGKVTVMGRYQ